MKNYKNDPVGRYLSDECIEYIEKLNEEKFNGKQFGRVLSAIIYDHDSLNKRIESMGKIRKRSIKNASHPADAAPQRGSCIENQTSWFH